ncbi:excinuclease ABC subunit UvrC [Candidatus Saccharibacteria bacterium]|nr:excinuclease ABC subunit UvrC [Candidatus Saccharibacteria bacterium]
MDAEALRRKLADLPVRPGVYYHLDKGGRIIYVGKAANLRARVRHYFQAASSTDRKTSKLRERIADVRWTLTDDPLQALFLEGEMIKRYQPKYNVLQRNTRSDDWHYVQCNLKAPNPYLTVTRNVDVGEDLLTLGPYLDGRALRKALRYLRRDFPYSTHKVLPRKACLDYHLGLCPGPETAGFDLAAAKVDLRRLLACLSGRRSQLVGRLRSAMKTQAAAQRYEAAAKLRNQIAALEDFARSNIFTDSGQKPYLGQDQALADLQSLFGLAAEPRRIETYDISHISGRYTAASMVVAEDGLIRPALSRRFKSPLAGNDDFGQIRAVMKRRFTSKSLREIRPDLILIDGGKGQVSSVLQVLDGLDLEIPVIGLAKKREQVIFRAGRLNLDADQLRRLGGSAEDSPAFTTLNLNPNTPLLKLLQRLRDASHRSALAYHNYLQGRDQVASGLLGIEGIGEKTYRKLIKRFGSLAGLRTAEEAELAAVLNRRQLAALKAYLAGRNSG